MANNDISDMFGISPIIEPGGVEKMVGSVDVLPAKPVEPPTPEDILHDFNIARKNVLEVIDTARDAIANVSDLATQSQDDKYYDSLVSALKVMLEANRDLIDMQMKIQEMTENIGGVVKQVQNNLFVGSTADLQKMIGDLIKKNPNG